MVTSMRALAASGTRWTARVLGAFLLGLVLLFLFGEGLPRAESFRSASLSEFLAFLAFLLMVAGMAIIWKREGLGGTIALAGFLAFLAVNRFRVGPVFLLFPLAGALDVLSWLTRKRAAPGAEGRPR